MPSAHLFFEGAPPPLAFQPGRFVGTGTSATRFPTASVERFFATLFAQTSLPVTFYRNCALQRRIPACLRFLRATSPDEARDRIEREPELAGATLSVALLGVSEFFRDQAVFSYLEREVVPHLVRGFEPPRIWSAACSTGQELYSVAMLLAEADRLDGCELLGTDCRRDATEQARTGVFPWASVAELGSGRSARFFVRARAAGVIRSELRQATCWKTADLFAGAQPGPWDLILWRNMAIYLETPAADAIWTSLCDVLAPEGWLVTGKAERPPENLPLVKTASCIYRKRPGGAA